MSVNGEKRYGEWLEGKRQKWLTEAEFKKVKGDLDLNYL